MSLHEARGEPEVRPPFAVRICCGSCGFVDAQLLFVFSGPFTVERRGAACPVYRCPCGDDVVIQTW